MNRAESSSSFDLSPLEPIQTAGDPTFTGLVIADKQLGMKVSKMLTSVVEIHDLDGAREALHSEIQDPNAGASCNSRSRHIPRRSGRCSRCAGLFRGIPPTVPAPESRSNLRPGLRPAGEGDGHQAGPVGATLAVAPRLRGTCDRHYPARVSGSPNRVQRAKPVPAPPGVQRKPRVRAWLYIAVRSWPAPSDRRTVSLERVSGWPSILRETSPKTVLRTASEPTDGAHGSGAHTDADTVTDSVE
jgi:hypothetical protein